MPFESITKLLNFRLLLIGGGKKIECSSMGMVQRRQLSKLPLLSFDETTGQPTSADTGELCVSGPGVALSYVRRNSLAKEKFTIYGYRTGDRVTIDHGRIFFLARIDTQVKIRGFRIELDEIEQEKLRISDDIRSATVIFYNEQLIVFIVGELTESYMRETLVQRYTTSIDKVE